MSVLVDFSIFPLDKGKSVSTYVAGALQVIKDSGLSYELGPMGTCIEGDWQEVMAVIERCFTLISGQSHRVYMALKVDYRKGTQGRIRSKVKSVEKKLLHPQRSIDG